MNISKPAVLILTLSVLLTTRSPAIATENGTTAYPIGVYTIANGIIPAPGETWVQNYSVYYDSSEYSDGSGNSLVPGFNSRAVVNATRVFHTWDETFGPFTLSSGVVLPLIGVDVRSDLSHSNDFALGDITLEPLYLGWSNPQKNFFIYGGVNVFVPTKTNVSNNFYSFAPDVNITWFPTSKLELSASFGAEFHTKNPETDYQSGTVLFLDWAANYRAFDALPNLGIGIQGYAVKQVTDDKIAGVVVGDGFRQQGFAIGPQISYAIGGGGIALKWQHEFDTEYRAKGDRVWLQFSMPVGK
ncbi:hypothetical protein FB593_12011 [Rhizobium sp. SJZ105]|uniref:SphA family protein n=1 Tax=Rhizobium sp. SJZ105 TaxID=2572678 RepID=UPI0011AD2D2C|nr:transporter [Rhizobium sp. SJZ105]TWC76438.1 hypothetical protein FB593_12011 [Rhizobium sp. SJZ105]